PTPALLLRMPVGKQYASLVRVWAPAQSPLRIEYTAELLRQVLREGAGEARGELWGRRGHGWSRLLASRRALHTRHVGVNGLERVGIFAVRRSGEVFLTEQDLQFFERSGLDVALVVAGQRGGFFLRDPNGSITAIRSREEFRVPAAHDTKGTGAFRSWLNI